ncbi:MAG: 2Fe-2S iron-sulfur cluster-binding protein [Planctomycetota bacterium]|nr:2Fe-2S iron-sulfur cluster-binding protein [Planctomycetota bacterium]
MVAAPVVNITVNGKAISARPGQTVLQAAADAGIEIPALCNHPHLRPEGSCRVCLVEIEKQRTLQPACTFPVADGMVVQTESAKAVESRKMVLQMIFSERSHYCMYCQMSGTAQSTDCELQKLGYRYGLNHWSYGPNYAKNWPIDATRTHFVMDHARCILCRRCVRACQQIAANHTLGVQQRGFKTMICADDNVQFGESSCVSCGTCLQVCPTGALADRRSAYRGHESEVTRTKAVCLGCSVGCGIEAITRDNQLLRVEGDWKAGNEGMLCSVGRFDVVEPKPVRIMWPMVRTDGRLVETSWDKALTFAAGKFRQAHRVAGLASPRLPNEALAAFACFFHEVLMSNEVGLLYGEDPPLELGQPAVLHDVAASDCIVIIAGNPMKQQKVVGHLIKRAYDNDARIIVVNDRPTELDSYAHLRLQLQDVSYHGESPFEQLKNTYHLRGTGVSQLKAAVEAAQRPVVLYGGGLTTTVYAALRALPAKVHFLPLINGTNAAGAARLGLRPRPVHGEALYVMVGDDLPDGMVLPHRQFTLVQSAYRSAWTESADVVLPAMIWAEMKGHMINIEGRSLPVAPLLVAPKSVHACWETLLQLSMRIGYSLSFDEISDISKAVV